MKRCVIAIDVDGTLIDNRIATPTANEDIRTLLVILSKFKNVRIVVWSGGGELYARQIAAAIGVSKYVHSYYSKNHMKCEDTGCEEPKNDTGFCGTHHFDAPIKPDVAIDDIQACDLGNINLIVNQK